MTTLSSPPLFDPPSAPAEAVLLAEVVFDLPLDRSFDYLVPASLAQIAAPGHRVSAPFGHRGGQVGIIVRTHQSSVGAYPMDKMKSLEAVLDPAPALSENDLLLARWITERYFCSYGEAVFAVLPVGSKRSPKRGFVSMPPDASASSTPPTPTPDQQKVLNELLPAVQSGAHRAFLLFGVAASGKTEVYLHAIAECLKAGKSAIYLVPEIGLTPQVEAILRARFGDTVAVWHSEMAPGERWKTWRRAQNGDRRVILGPRSALFLPAKDLGLIVVDEEHDPSYKEDTRPHYHAREAAVEKARLHKAVAILGSATPSMESWHAASQGRLEVLEMHHRVEERPFPVVTMVDMRGQPGKLFSEPLAQAMQENLDRKETSLLFLNRRGFATHVACRACGWEARCPDCGVSLVYHKDSETGGAGEGLHCHYCFKRDPVPSACPTCGEAAVKMKGKGTQRVEADLGHWFPGARALRWDRDSTRKRGAHARAHEAVSSESVDIIIGTQMIAQGLDFPLVTLVGVLDADQSLRFPDFRASERTFQLLTQVAGRAGRGGKPGRVFLQTSHPEHYAVQAAHGFDFRKFAEAEMAFRREMAYPPFLRLMQIVLRGKKPEQVETSAESYMAALEAAGFPSEVQLLGPAPAYRPLREKYTHWQILVKAPEAAMPSVFARLKTLKPSAGVTLSAAPDPEDLA